MLRSDTALHPPVSRPRTTGQLAVSDGHVLWWEEIGAEEGIPLLVLHGGPGGRIAPYYRRLPDPARHRAVFFEQRGCGRSTPTASLEHNDTWRLVEDIERLRVARNIERWIVLGGSWGSTLALAYAQKYPQSVSALLLSGVFLARTEDIDWWWEGSRRVFPDTTARRDEFLPPDERVTPRESYLRRILHPDPAVHAPAAQMLMLAEFATLELWPSLMLEDPDTLDPLTVGAGRMMAHYDHNRFFLAENQLIRDSHKLAGIPGEIIAGRADICTPPKAAFDLSRAWAGSHLTIVPAAGHRWNDEMLCRDLLAALGRLTDRVAAMSSDGAR